MAQAQDSATPAIEVAGLSKHFGEFQALSSIDLSVRKGEFFSLLGPSGCGKTTLLRILGGLELLDEGTVRIGGVDARTIPAHKRPVNTVFQSYALFPHLTVKENVAFGLRMKRVPPAQIETRVAKCMELVQIESFAKRRPAQLSGGQKQRVALARALVNEPQVLLLDEPLGALDLKLRKELQVELLQLQRRLGITFVYVTHDQEEALVMSDRIAVMRAGRIEQMGDAEDLYERPHTRFVGQFLGSCNLIEASIIAPDVSRPREAGLAGEGDPAGPTCNPAPGGFFARTPIGPLRIGEGPNSAALAGRSSATLAIRPEKVSLLPLETAPGIGAGGENRVAVTVRQLIYIGSETHYILTPESPAGTAPPPVLTAYAMNSRAGSQGFDIGQKAVAYFPPAGLVVLED